MWQVNYRLYGKGDRRRRVEVSLGEEIIWLASSMTLLPLVVNAYIK